MTGERKKHGIQMRTGDYRRGDGRDPVQSQRKYLRTSENVHDAGPDRSDRRRDELPGTKRNKAGASGRTEKGGKGSRKRTGKESHTENSCKSGGKAVGKESEG